MSKILVLQHAPCETLGTIANALQDAALAWQYFRVFQGAPLPKEIGEAGGLIVMGGPMGVYEQDRYPHLRDEIRLVEAALKAEIPILGVCLGSQLLASVLGAQIRKADQKEIGWHDLRLTDSAASDRLFAGLPNSVTVFHWHGDVFDLPKDATSLAKSQLTEHQAFRFGDHVYGLLFHLEVTETMVKEMVDTFADEVREAGADGAAIVAKASEHLPALHKFGETIFSRWAEAVYRG
jgi:GMP synthase (glutamine-hydrolysing)